MLRSIRHFSISSSHLPAQLTAQSTSHLEGYLCKLCSSSVVFHALSFHAVPCITRKLHPDHQAHRLRERTEGQVWPCFPLFIRKFVIVAHSRQSGLFRGSWAHDGSAYAEYVTCNYARAVPDGGLGRKPANDTQGESTDNYLELL